MPYWEVSGGAGRYEGAKAKCLFGPMSCWVLLTAAENGLWGQGDLSAVGKQEFGVFSNKGD